MNNFQRLIMCTLVAVFLAMAGCRSSDEDVPKAHYGQSAKQEKTGRALPPAAPPQQRFAELDRNGDGSLDRSEFLQNAGTANKRTGEAQLFREIDGNRDGSVSLDEFIHRPAKFAHHKMDKDANGLLSFQEFYEGDMAWANAEQAQRVFELMDLNDNGTLETSEYLSRPSEAWFARSDLDGDGLLSLEEYGARNNALVGAGHCELVFRLIDEDGNGMLSPTEFADAPPEQAFYRRDNNGDGILSLEEFLVPFATAEQQNVRKAIFDEKDCDRSGSLSLAEFKLTTREAKFRRLDLDLDGEISMEEFAANELTPEGMARAVHVFSARDLDEDGNLSILEFSGASAAVTFYEKDADGDGLLSKEECLAEVSGAEAIRLETDLFMLRDRDANDRLTLSEYTAHTPEVAFRMMDRDGNGELDLAEFRQSDVPNGSDQCVKRAFEATDADGSGGIGPTEYSSRSNRAWFRCMDVDADDRLSREEFAVKNTALVETNRFEPLFKAMDSDGNLAVSEEEYCRESTEVSFIRRDDNGDGKLAFAEYSGAKDPDASAQAKKDFDRKDIDKDGMLTVQEFGRRLKAGTFHEKDADGDGLLSKEECLAGVSSADSIRLETDLFMLRDRDANDRLTLSEYTTHTPEVAFRKMDRDGNGELDLAEFRQSDVPDGSDQCVKRAFEATDADGSGGIGPTEYGARSNRAWFMRMDVDADDRLSREEFAARNTALVETNRFEPLFKAMDSDGNLAVSEEEYCRESTEVSFIRRDDNGDGKLAFAEYSGAKDPDASAQAKKDFDRKDTDKDGMLTVQEFGRRLKAGTFHEKDADGDGLLSKKECLAGVSGADSIRLETDLFMLRDRDANDRLTLSEYTTQTPEVAFRKMDRDGNGELDLAEFRQSDVPDGSDQCVKLAFEATDADGSGGIGPTEYGARSNRAWFMRMDIDADGRLSREEFAARNTALVQTNRFEPLFKAMDSDGNLAVSEEEYCRESTEVSFIRRDDNGDGRLAFAEYSGAKDPDSSAQAKKDFDRKDIDKDGMLTVQEFGPRLKAGTFHEKDADGDGLLSKEECLAGVSGADSVRLETDLFMLRDRDANDRLTLSEYTTHTPEVSFRKMDRDGNGELDLAEFRASDVPNGSDQCAKRAFEATDTDGSGGIAPTEYTSRSNRAWFMCMDVDADGRLSREEFAARNTALVQTKRFEPLFKAMDSDGNLAVSEEEYCRESTEVSFIRRDDNGDGKLAFAEYSGTKDPDASAQAKKDFDRKDTDKDGMLTIPEFADATPSPTPK